jgi:hypothetical protein
MTSQQLRELNNRKFQRRATGLFDERRTSIDD